MKKFVAMLCTLALAAGCALGLTACGGGSDENEIVVWCEATGSDVDVMDAFCEYFNENNDMGYTMTYVMQESVSSSLSSASLGGAAPDLVIWPRWETVSRTNLLHDLTDKIAASDVISPEDYNEAARSELEIGGAVYGVPTDLDAWGLWCNMDLMEESQIPSTWDELKASTEALTSGSGSDIIVGLDAYNLRGQFYSFMLSAGAQLVDDSGIYPVININTSDTSSASYQDALSVMQLFIDLMEITGCPTDYHTDDMFIAGKVAMKFGPSNYAQTVEGLLGSEMNLTFVGYPAKSETEGAVTGMLGGYSLAVPAASDLDKGFEVMEWWLSDENLTKYCELYGLLPAKTSLQSASFVSESEVLTTMLEMLPDCDVRPVVKGYSNVETSVIFSTIDALREYVRTGSGSVTSAAAAIEQIKTRGDAQFQLEAIL